MNHVHVNHHFSHAHAQHPCNIEYFLLNVHHDVISFFIAKYYAVYVSTQSISFESSLRSWLTDDRLPQEKKVEWKILVGFVIIL